MNREQPSAGPITLTGIAWDHSRAFPPLVAAAQRHGELNPGIRVRWEKRSLHEFGHMPLERMIDRFDLIVIDHPFAGRSFAQGLMVDLMPLVDHGALRDAFVGPSFASYEFHGRLLAIPLDAATPCPFWREDRLDSPPQTIEEVLRLGKGLIMPGFGPDLFLNWIMLSEALGGRCFTTCDRVTDPAPGRQAIELLSALAGQMPREIVEWNPIRVHALLSSSDDFVYCPFAYTYSNYARPRFAKHALTFGNLVTLNGRRLRSVIGGTGIAISPRCAHLATAVEHALFCTSEAVQVGVYAMAGGQPALRAAWDDDLVNAASGNFFRNTRISMDEAIVRPRYDGYVPLQENAGAALQSCIMGRAISADAAMEAVDTAYRASLPPGDALPLS